VYDRSAEGYRDSSQQTTTSREQTTGPLCEGAGRSGGSKRQHFQIAYGSAAECHGAVGLCKAYGVNDADQALELLGHVRRMLAGLLR